jgi:hypothetical protein
MESPCPPISTLTAKRCSTSISVCPDTPLYLSRFNLRLVFQLWDRQIPLRVVESAFLLAPARRGAFRPDAMPSDPSIRSVTSSP